MVCTIQIEIGIFSLNESTLAILYIIAARRYSLSFIDISENKQIPSTIVRTTKRPWKALSFLIVDWMMIFMFYTNTGYFKNLVCLTATWCWDCIGVWVLRSLISFGSWLFCKKICLVKNNNSFCTWAVLESESANGNLECLESESSRKPLGPNPSSCIGWWFLKIQKLIFN